MEPGYLQKIVDRNAIKKYETLFVKALIVYS